MRLLNSLIITPWKVETCQKAVDILPSYWHTLHLESGIYNIAYNIF